MENVRPRLHVYQTMIPALGIAAFAAAGPLAPWRFERREVGASDVQIQILYCGICHSDLHTVRGEWGPCPYPQVPGHEIVGRVRAVGQAVTRWQVSTAAVSATHASRGSSSIATMA